MFKNGLVPKSCYFGTMVQLVQESPTRLQQLGRFAVDKGKLLSKTHRAPKPFLPITSFKPS